jgi:AraC-like DNA-binding protein
VPIRYAEFAPSPALADAVRCFWTITGAPDASDAPMPNRVLPDNCIDVIFDLRATARTSAFAVGPMLEAQVFYHRNEADMLGVRFSPGAATEFLDLEATDLLPADIPVAEIWNDSDALAEQLSVSAGAERLGILDSYLCRRRRVNRTAALARRATAIITRARGMMTVESLTQMMSMTERTLQRTFVSAVGIAPKQVLKVQRFRSAAAMIAGGRALPLSRIAATCGYADQSHLTRDFTSLAGVSPKAFQDEHRLVGFVQD